MAEASPSTDFTVEESVVGASPSTDFTVEESFSSYKQLEGKVKLYERTRFIQLVHTHSRTLEGARKRVPKRVQNAKMDLRYYSIRLTCAFGGKKYKRKSLGSMTHQRYCTYFFLFGVFGSECVVN